MLKTAAALVFTVSATVSCSAQEQISLPQPSKSLETTVIEALQNRRSERVFAEKQMSDQDLASLLWAANGINREDGRRTAPSAINAQDIDIYVPTAHTYGTQKKTRSSVYPTKTCARSWPKARTLCCRHPCRSYS